MMKTIAHIALLVLLLSCAFSLVSVTKADLIGHKGLIAAYKPYIVFLQNNHIYSSNSLMLNVSFKAMAWANMNYSGTYSLDGKPNETLPLQKHYFSWVVSHGSEDYVDGSVKLPVLSEGSHTITVFLTLDWEIGEQNGVTVYTYYDTETVKFTITQDTTEQPVEPSSEPSIIVPFSYDELSSQIIVTEPNNNFTYSESDIVVNVSLHIGGHEYETNTHYVPYQNITCVYSLDDSEWQNMTRISAIKSELFPSIPNNFWYSNMFLNYTATLHDVSEGLHYLKIDVKPDTIHTRDINSTQEQSLVYFNVINQHSTVPVSDSSLLLAGTLVLPVVVLSSIGLLVYFKKHKERKAS